MTLSFGLTNGDTGLLYAKLAQNSSTTMGWVCDDGFDDVEAAAICNSLNGSFLFFEDSQILMDDYNFTVDISCSGTENLTQCSWTDQNNCNFRGGIFLDCSGPQDWLPGPISFGMTEVDHGLL